MKAEKAKWVWKWMPNKWWNYLLPADIGFNKGVEYAWVFWVIVNVRSK